MVWSKAAGHTFTTKQALGEWLMTDLLVRNGWTFNWRNSVGVDEFFSISRTYTTQSGAVLPYQLVYEFEYTASDVLVYSLDTTTGTDFAAWDLTSKVVLLSDSSYNPLLNTGNITVWEDDSSDAFIAYQNGYPFALQLDPAGWLVDTVNVSYFPGTRPYYAILPVGEYDIQNMTLLDGAASSSYYTTNAIVRREPGATTTDYGLYQDYVALSCAANAAFHPTAHWEDPSGLMKMKAHEYITSWSGYEVVKIDAEYYITAGPLLLPVGQTEPTL